MNEVVRVAMFLVQLSEALVVEADSVDEAAQKASVWIGEHGMWKIEEMEEL